MQHAKRTTTRTHTRLLAACLLGLAPGTAAATPVIAELFYDAVGSDDGSTFVEIYGEPGTVLDGLTVEGVNGAGGGIGPIVSLFGVIAEDGVFVLADRLSDGSTFVSDFDQLANFDFQNGPDSVQLVDGDVVIDARFSTGTHEYVCTPHEMMGMKGTITVRNSDPAGRQERRK